MVNFTQHVSSRQTPQSAPIFGTTQVPNSAGGFAWTLDDWKRLDRFLILGSEGGTYYIGERELTVGSAEAVLRCLRSDGPRLVARVVEISEAGRAPKNDPALFVLALAAGMGDDRTRSLAYAALPRVARTGTHLFTFLQNVKAFRGWGRGLRHAVASWYTRQISTSLAYQLAKYRQRGGFSHRDALRLAHPKPPTVKHQALFRWVTQGDMSEELPRLISDFAEIQAAATADQVIEVMIRQPGISWEMIPTNFLGEAKVWEALLPNLPLGAMLRNLARMTASGLITPMSQAEQLVADRLGDEARLRSARIHPYGVLVALKTYTAGHGQRGQLVWEPTAGVMDALDRAFYHSFGNVVPSGKRQLLALDVSGSMGFTFCGAMSCREAAAAMALVTAAVEPHHQFVAFQNSLTSLAISSRQRLDDVVDAISDLPFGGTDCALPMTEALRRGWQVDTFVVYTDSETWSGSIHPSQALRQYRERTGIPAKLVVVGMEGNEFTIADPDDAGMLDVVGFDAATPQLISDFALE